MGETIHHTRDHGILFISLS